VKKTENELDDIVIKALGHSERKNILRIVGGYPEGVTYTGILGESGLSTGRLNYHLGELEGFLERDDDRLYSLSEIGKRAVATLDFINRDVDISLLRSVNTKRADRLKAIRRRLDYGFYAVTAVMVGVTGLFAYFAYFDSDPVLTSFTGIWALFAAGIIYLTDRSRKNDPDRILWVWEWLEWKLVGNYKNKGYQ
jgi:hypothetical protein